MKTVLIRLLSVLLLLQASGAMGASAGLTTPGSNTYPNFLPHRVSGFEFSGGNDPFTAGAPDLANGYAYLGVDEVSGPPQIYKIQLGFGNSPTSRVAVLNLSTGEAPHKMLLDPVHGYLYVVTKAIETPIPTPSKVIKLALNPGDAAPTRVSDLTLQAGDVCANAVIDPFAGYLYVTTDGTPGRIVKVQLGTGNAAPVRLGSLDLNAGENNLQAAAIDTAAGVLYVGTVTSPGLVVKVALGVGNALPTRLGVTTLSLNKVNSAVIDVASGYLYVTTSDSITGRSFIKMALRPGAQPPEVRSSLDLQVYGALGSVIDTNSGHAYVHTSTGFPAYWLLKIRLNAGDAAPSCSFTLGGDLIGCDVLSFVGFVDATSGYVYTLARNSLSSPIGTVQKIATGGVAGGMAEADFRQFSLRQELTQSIGYDAAKGHLYALAANTSKSLLRTTSGVGNAAPAFLQSTPSTGNNNVLTALYNFATGYAFVGKVGNVVEKFNISSGISSVSSVGGVMPADFPRGGVIDTINNFAYFWNGNASCDISKLELGSTNAAPVVRGFVNINGGGQSIGTGVVDGSRLRGYFAVFASPATIHTLNLGIGTGAPTLGTSITLNSGENQPTCSVIDIANNHAYFGTNTTPGKIVKLDLSTDPPTRLGALTLEAGEGPLRTATIDTANKVAYFSTGQDPAQVIKIALGNVGAPPVRIGSITLEAGESPTSADFDTSTGYAYLLSATSPGRITKVATAVAGRLKATRMVLTENATVNEMRFYSHTASGKLRLAIYDNSSPKQLVWQSAEIVNTTTAGEITATIASGIPSQLILNPGTYWLAWQSESILPVPSFTPGSFGDGFYLDKSFGSFDATLGDETVSDERWTQYLNFTSRPTFVISGSSTQVAGASQNITITARNAANTTLTSYTGVKSLIFTGANASTNPVTQPQVNSLAFNTPINVTFTNGVATIPLRLFKVETAVIACSDPALNASTGTALSVTVTPQAVQHFRLSGPATIPVGSNFSLDLTAEDNFGNLVSSYSGAHLLTFGGPGSSSAPVTVPQIAGGNVGTVRSVNFTSGQASVSATLYKAETVSVTVSEGAVAQFPAYSITAQPGVLSKFGLSGNATQVAGTAQNITIFALDAFGNTATSSNGPLNVTFSGAAASANGSQPTGNGQNFGTSIPLVFINGVVSAPIVLVKDEVALVAAVSGAINTPSALSVDVQPANAAALTLSTPVSTQFQNQSLSYTVAAFDSFGNAALGYSGALAFTSSDPLAVLPANILITSNANVTLRTVGNQSVNVTDTLNAALTATRIITVNSATPTSITATLGTPQSATVGTAFTTPLRATVLDSLNQPIAGASVVFSTPSTGASGSFDGVTTVITDGNGVASAPGFNANTLPGTYNVTAGVNALTATFALTNTVGAPVSITASAGSNQNATVGAAFATALAATVRDQFNNPISGVSVTFAVPGTGASGTFASSATVATNSSGVATAPTLTANNTPGTFTATATAGVLQAMYTLTSLNDAPVAQTQNLSVLEGNPLAITLTASDLTSSTPTFTLVTTPQHGTLTGTAPNYTYTPEANFTGPDSFNFKANDGLLDSSITSIFITVQTNNAKPTISAISQSAGTLNQSPFTLTVTGTNFVSGAVVTWNGQPLTTAFVSSTQLTASVTALQLASAGNIPVAVQNPVPQRATSNSLSYFLYSGAVGTWIVTNTNDAGQGSLRLALASARSGDAIIFDPVVFDLVNSDAETLINVLSELPALDDGNVSLDASDRRVSINGAAASSARGLVVDSDNNIIRGLSILGFERSGISIRPGAASNVIGGSRTTGSGPNGQGLRISGNGTYGVEILGAGATGNSVKGCWIGLDAGGTSAQPNLAGIIIGDGATANTIGSTLADEENVVSGNSLEGITVAGAGTDDNSVIGNAIGATAEALASRSESSQEGIPGRSSAGNGSAGLFLSKDTKNTKNGGTAAGEGNSVAFNGGNGIEVRSRGARRNSARGNRITSNTRGGIALFDGSNDGVKAPVVDSFQRIPTRSSAGVQNRATASARVKGTVAGNGAIELFNDSGDQGAVLVGRSSAANGAFEVEIDIDDLMNLTATFTDENGNTSPFGFFGRVNGNGAESPEDVDGDGFTNSVEILAGTDPQNAAVAPVSGGALAVDAARISLNFATSNKDSLTATVRVAMPAGVTLPQSTVGLMVGGVTKSFLLDAKLRSPKAASTLKAVTSGNGAVFKFALRNEILQAGLNASGLTNSTTAKTGESKSVAVVLILKSETNSSYAYAGVVNLVYKATQGKTGKASKAK